MGSDGNAAGPVADSSVPSCALSFSFVLEVNGHGSNKTVSQNGPFILTWPLWLIFFFLRGSLGSFVVLFGFLAPQR